MQVTLYTIKTNTPTISVDHDLGQSTLTELYLRDGLILWNMNGMYALVSRGYIKEAKRICDDSPGSDYIFVWSQADRISPEAGRLLSSN